MASLYSCDVVSTLYMALPPRDQRHQYLRFEGLEYTDVDITDFEDKLVGCSWSIRIVRGRGFSETIINIDSEGTLQFQLGGDKRRTSWRQFILALGLHTAEEMETAGFRAPPSYTYIRDPMLRLCHRLIACSIARRSQAPKKETVTDLFYLRGVDIFEELDDTWAWVAPGPERQPNAVAGALEVAKGAPNVDEGAQVIPAPIQAP
ncbi:hypothetical protein Tco_0904133 [Tanacetum coccineum]